MGKREIIILGGGGQACVVMDMLVAANQVPAGYVAPKRSQMVLVLQRLEEDVPCFGNTPVQFVSIFQGIVVDTQFGYGRFGRLLRHDMNPLEVR